MHDASAEPHDESDFEQVWRAHAAFAQRVLRRFGVRPSDVADAAQDVFVVVHRKLPELEHRAALRTWLYRICARVAADYRKRAHRRYEQIDERAADAPIADAQEAAARHAQLVARLERALDGLGDDQRRVFVLYELEELSMSEIAAVLGCPLKTAFSRLYAARRELRADLRRAGFASAPLWLWPWAPWRSKGMLELHAALVALGHTGSFATAATFLTLLALAAPIAPEGSMLAQASASSDAAPWHARRSAYRLEALSAPPPPPSAPELRAVRTRGARRARASEPRARPSAAAQELASAAAVSAPPQAWVRAPDPAPAQRPALEPRKPGVGLDEVLAVTSVDALMRLPPARERASLVPGRPASRRARITAPRSGW